MFVLFLLMAFALLVVVFVLGVSDSRKKYRYDQVDAIVFSSFCTLIKVINGTMPRRSHFWRGRGG
jgi:hypothetical protein